MGLWDGGVVVLYTFSGRGWKIYVCSKIRDAFGFNGARGSTSLRTCHSTFHKRKRIVVDSSIDS